MSRILRRVLIRNLYLRHAPPEEPVDRMDWEETPPEDPPQDPPQDPTPSQQHASEASHQQPQPGLGEAEASIYNMVQETNTQVSPISHPNPGLEPPQINPQPRATEAPMPAPQPLPSGSRFYDQNYHLAILRAQAATRMNFTQELASRRPSGRLGPLAPISNRQAYMRDAVQPSELWYRLRHDENLAMQRQLDELRNQSTVRRGRAPYPYTPRSFDFQSTSPNSRKRRIEAVDGYSQNENRTARDVDVHSPHNAMPESPIDTSMVDAPPYESSPLQASPSNGRPENGVSQILPTDQHMPGTWPTDIFNLSEADVGIIRDHVARMSGALAEYPRISSQGTALPLSNSNDIRPNSPEHAHQLQRELSYLQKVEQIISNAYFPVLKAMRFAIQKVGNKAVRTYREFVQAAVEVTGSAKRRAVAIRDKLTPEFIRRKMNHQHQAVKTLRRLNPSERHILKARRLGMGKKKQDSSSLQVTLDEYEDITPPRPPRDMPPSVMINSYRLPKEKVPTKTLCTAQKDRVVKGARVQKGKLHDKAKLKAKTPSQKLTQLTQKGVNKVAMPRAPRRGELIKGAWPNAIPPNEAVLRAYHESFRELRNKPMEAVSETAKPSGPPKGYHGVYFPGEENQPPLPPLPSTSVPPSSPPSPPSQNLAGEPTSQPEASVETEEPGPPKEALRPSSPEYEGFLTRPPRPRREAKEVHWLQSESPMGRPISSMRAYDPLSRVTSFQPHEPAKAEASGRQATKSINEETSTDMSVQRSQALLRSPETPSIKHLTASWEAKVDRAMALSDKSEVGITPRGQPLLRRSLNKCYTNLEWLNDEVINAYLELIVDYARQEAGNSGRHDKPKYHAFPSFFFSNLRDKGYESVRRWATRAKIGGEALLQVETVLIPVHDHLHWTLIVVRPTARTIEHFDSMGSPSLAHISRAKEWLRGELGDLFVEEEWRVLPSTSPQQTNGSDCGVFLLTNAKLVSLGKPLRYGARDIPEIRKRIVAELMNGGFFGDFDPKKDETGPVRSML
ncbi:sentrin/SUMO-specific protease [Histoplasma capsulatum G186AR]|uniref:Sentrin/SUMO-specific protease n=1 Tax=Ajellomyces capsulatus TaxID=5037 RepID=A0A8H7YKL8_AJECA|nr:sentrin/SUMO-specific protease [Histoplasma capsulatum]QSS75568.1 sentrin/SUMO-specific protease [Histoplasma capsulatum G186AR]